MLMFLTDQHLYWKPLLLMLHVMFPSLDDHVLLTYPFLTYCNVAWSSTYCSNLKCIHPFAKALRAAHNKSSLSSEYYPFI